MQQRIAELNYNEVIEMAYYGAQVIHPKTIKPLQNKNIPLYVKCFLDPSLPGTVIHHHSLKKLPPIIVLKEKQVMLETEFKRFFFCRRTSPDRQLYQVFERLKIKPNLTQNGAISFTTVYWMIVLKKLKTMALEAATTFDVQVTKELSLLTIRHYNKELFEKLTAGRNILLRQQTPETIQLLMQ